MNLNDLEKGHKMEIKSKYSKKERVKLTFPENGRTKQEFREQCNINKIMDRFYKRGVLPEMIKKNPQYGDFSNATDYQNSLHLVMKAQEQFQALSSKVRSQFDNDPQKFLEFAENPENKEKMAELDLLKPEVVEAMKAAKLPKNETKENDKK